MHPEVPGGDPALPVWAALNLTSPDEPQQFLASLLEKDNGRLLHFYFVLSQLDANRQRFFTASLQRTKAFYEAFRQSSQVVGALSRDMTLTSISDLFRELPLDESGRVLFPGGPDVWLAAKNRAASSMLTAHLASRRAQMSAVPIYAIAEGDALRQPKLLDTLAGLVTDSGGLVFHVERANELDEVFATIAHDVENTYLLAWKLPENAGRAFRTVKITITEAPGAQIRTRRGYLPN